MNAGDLLWAVVAPAFAVATGGVALLAIFIRRHRGEMVELREAFLTSKRECGHWMRRCFDEEERNASLQASLRAAQAALSEEREDADQWKERWAAEVRQRPQLSKPANGHLTSPELPDRDLAGHDKPARAREKPATRRDATGRFTKRSSGV